MEVSAVVGSDRAWSGGLWSKRQAWRAAPPGARKRRRTRRRRQPGSRTDGPLRTLRRLSAGQRQPDQGWRLLLLRGAPGRQARPAVADDRLVVVHLGGQLALLPVFQPVVAWFLPRCFFLALLFPTEWTARLNLLPSWPMFALTAAPPRRPSAAWCWRRTGSAISIRSCRRR